MKKFLSIMALALTFSMVSAQDVTPPAPGEPTPTLGSIEITVTPGGEPVLPPDAPPVDYTPYILVGLGVVIIIVLGLFGGALWALYNSSPPTVKEIIKVTLDAVLKQYEERTRMSPDTFDDKVAEELRRLFEEFINRPDSQLVARITAQVKEDLRHDDRKMWNIEQPKNAGG